jgi:hypothetical protein
MPLFTEEMLNLFHLYSKLSMPPEKSKFQNPFGKIMITKLCQDSFQNTTVALTRVRLYWSFIMYVYSTLLSIYSQIMHLPFQTRNAGKK